MDKILYLQKIKIGSFLSLLAQEVYRRFGFSRTIKHCCVFKTRL